MEQRAIISNPSGMTSVEGGATHHVLMTAPAQQLAPEVEEGNREYKLMLTNLTDEQLIHRTTQLNWRLNEGNGEAFYLIGVEDNGNQLGLTEDELKESLRNLQFMANEVRCEMTVSKLFTASRGLTAEVHMKRKERQAVNIAQMAICVIGDVDSGKSTLIGVLSSGRLCNGRGLARSSVCTHNHELASGRTSCISHHSLHFSHTGQVLNADFQLGVKGSAVHRLRALSDLELAGEDTKRVVSLIDLAGHAKYLKTTLHGMMGRHPQYSLICVSAMTGLQPMTTEHIGISLYLKIPMIIAISKIDVATKEQLESTLNNVKKILSGPNKRVIVISNKTELNEYLTLVNPQPVEESVVADIGTAVENNIHYSPIFLISNVTGVGLELLQECFFRIPNTDLDSESESFTDSTVTLAPIGNDSVKVETLKPFKSSTQTTAHLNLNNSVEVHILASIGKTPEEVSSEEELSADEDEEAPTATPAVRRCFYNPNRSGSNKNSGKVRTISTENLTQTVATPVLPLSFTDTVHPGVVDNLADSNVDALNEGVANLSITADIASIAGHSTAVEDNAMQPGLHPVPSVETIFKSGNTSTDSLKGLAAREGEIEKNSSVNTASAWVEFVDYVDISAGGTGSNTKVLVGYIQTGSLSIHDTLLLGPSNTGQFITVTVTSIRLNNVPIQCAMRGQTVTFKLSGIGPASAVNYNTSVTDSIYVSSFKSSAAPAVASHGSTGSARNSPGGGGGSVTTKRSTASGLVLTSTHTKPTAYWEFDAELLILNHPNRIRVNYEPVIHVGCVKQAARIVSMRKVSAKGDLSIPSLVRTDSDVLTSICNGERAICRFRFLYYPEYLTVNSALIIREERTKGVGTVLNLVA